MEGRLSCQHMTLFGLNSSECDTRDAIKKKEKDISSLKLILIECSEWLVMMSNLLITLNTLTQFSSYLSMFALQTFPTANLIS